MSVTSGGTALKSLSWVGRFGRNFDDLFDVPRAVVAMPEPNRGGQILNRNDHANEAVSLPRVMRGTHLENHLLLAAQIEGLHMPAAAQIPDVHLVPVFAA